MTVSEDHLSTVAHQNAFSKAVKEDISQSFSASFDGSVLAGVMDAVSQTCSDLGDICDKVPDANARAAGAISKVAAGLPKMYAAVARTAKAQASTGSASKKESTDAGQEESESSNTSGAQSTCFLYQTYGGCPTENIQQWTESITADSRLVPVDRGSDLIAIWDLILQHYSFNATQEEQESTQKFCNYLKEEFKKSVGKDCFCPYCQEQFLPSRIKSHMEWCSHKTVTEEAFFTPEEAELMDSGDYELCSNDGTLGLRLNTELTCTHCGEKVLGHAYDNHIKTDCTCNRWKAPAGEGAEGPSNDPSQPDRVDYVDVNSSTLPEGKYRKIIEMPEFYQESDDNSVVINGVRKEKWHPLPSTRKVPGRTKDLLEKGYVIKTRQLENASLNGECISQRLDKLAQSSTPEDRASYEKLKKLLKFLRHHKMEAKQLDCLKTPAEVDDFTNEYGKFLEEEDPALPLYGSLVEGGVVELDEEQVRSEAVKRAKRNGGDPASGMFWPGVYVPAVERELQEKADKNHSDNVLRSQRIRLQKEAMWNFLHGQITTPGKAWPEWITALRNESSCKDFFTSLDCEGMSPDQLGNEEVHKKFESLVDNKIESQRSNFNNIVLKLKLRSYGKKTHEEMKKARQDAVTSKYVAEYKGKPTRPAVKGLILPAVEEHPTAAVDMAKAQEDRDVDDKACKMSAEVDQYFPCSGIQQLTEMGFTEDQAKHALEVTDGNIENAVSLLA